MRIPLPLRRGGALVVLMLGACAIPSAAQVIYEPVQSQYLYDGKIFYYGGHDARVFDYVVHDIDRMCYTSAVTQVPVVHRQRIYSDRIPFENLADDHRTSYRTFTSADAQNEANAAAPCYFRKRDLLRAAELEMDGTLVVPADARPRVDVKVRVPDAMRTPVEKGTILIIPKKMLEPQHKDASSVAMNK